MCISVSTVREIVEGKHIFSWLSNCLGILKIKQNVSEKSGNFEIASLLRPSQFLNIWLLL